MNGDGVVSLSDALALRRFLFIAGPLPTCMDAADTDDGQPVEGCPGCTPGDGQVNITDAVLLLRYLFLEADWSAILREPFPSAGADPTSDDPFTCGSSDIVAPETTGDTVRLGEVEASPGESVEIPVYLTNSVPVEAIQLVIDYDPAVMQPVEGGEGVSYEGTFYEDLDLSRVDVALVKAHPGHGVFTLGIVGSLGHEGFEVPPGEDWLVAKIRGVVPEDAPPGTVVELVPTNGPDGQGTGPYRLRNELTYLGEARFVSTLPRREGALLKVVGDLSFFRGDSNSDGELNLSDALYTLDYLFKASAAPRCMDAADANDDGQVNLADPVVTLLLLFGGVTSLPPPYPELGSDPSGDSLGCVPAST